MHSYIEVLTNLLLSKNEELSHAKAKTWVELLWEDFEATYAKAGHEYRGPEMTEKYVRQLIETYGADIHRFLAGNSKYKHLFEENEPKH
ncbi:YfhJ family protein [Peribacillus kribbensis]|uniref:YfhJ family protein n=1 Tax=Peribacillus kribbensis TaxID=356658 RepID=UPI00040371AD|nr:YfhJ family protein [Peribacillus kribbensis]